MTIAKKIALITGGNIHNEERETPLPSLGRRQRAHRLVPFTSRMRAYRKPTVFFGERLELFSLVEKPSGLLPRSLAYHYLSPTGDHYPHGASRLHYEGLGANNGGKYLKRKYQNGAADS